MLKVAIAATGVVLFLAPPVSTSASATLSNRAVQLAQAGGSLCQANLTGTINRIVTRIPGVRWGVVVQTVAASNARSSLYIWNPRVLMTPASNNKLFTTAAALQKLGAQYRIRTIVTGSNATGNSTGSNLATLRITGQGDPSLKTAQLTPLAQQVRQRGVRQVALLVGDDTYFRGATVNPNWDADDTLAGYGAPVNSLMLNQNAIGLTLIPQRVGQPLRIQWDDPSDAQDWRLDNQTVTVAANRGESVDAYRDRSARLVHVEGQLRAGSASELVAASISNPGNYLIQKFRTALTAQGVAVAQSTVVKNTPAPTGEVELAVLESPPLSVLLNETNQESNNIYAEALLKTIGKAQNSTNADATASGVAAIKAVLAPLGVESTQYSMTDGSGLASNNRASATAFVQTLQAMAASPNAQVFRDSLPVGGVSGTLKDRFRNTAAQGRVQAKTGTISGVVSLSGYLTPPNYPPVAFSILTNYSGAATTTVRSAVDEIVLVLTRVRSC